MMNISVDKRWVNEMYSPAQITWPPMKLPSRPAQNTWPR